MKNIVKTTGDFSLRDTTHRLIDIKMKRPTVVFPTPFVQERIATGALELLGVVNDDATQEEMLEYLKESEGEELAIASFLSAFPVEKPSIVPPPIPAPAEAKPAQVAKPAAPKPAKSE